MKKQIETRNGVGEVRKVEEGSRHVEGYAVVFDSWSQDLGGFREKINPKALDGVIDRSDVFALLNHDRTRGILGRCKRGDMKSLKLEIDEHGLKYSFEAPSTPLGDEVLSCLERGEIDSSSFAFTTLDDKWTRNGDVYEREIMQIDELYDVSPVYNPAYLETSCDKRGMETLQAEERAEEERKAAEAKAEEERIAFGKYIADLKAEINPNPEKDE